MHCCGNPTITDSETNIAINLSTTDHHHHSLGVESERGVTADSVSRDQLISSLIAEYSMDQPSKVANPARSQLNRENDYSPVPVRA